MKDDFPSYPGSSRGLWRLKLVLAYCLLASLLVCLGVFLRLAVSLALHWNTEVPLSAYNPTKPVPISPTQVHTNPLPFSVTSAGAIYLTEMAGTNLHLSSLLLALSRSPGDGRGGDWYSPVRFFKGTFKMQNFSLVQVRPVMYSPAGREEQLHLWDLSAHPSPAHKS